MAAEVNLPPDERRLLIVKQFKDGIGKTLAV